MTLTVNGAGDRVYGVKVVETEGEAAQIEIVRAQTGLAGFDDAGEITVSYRGLSLARGRVAEPPSDLFGPYQTLVAVCSGPDLSQDCVNYGRWTLGRFTNSLFSDFDGDDPDSYLKGLAAVWYVDPVKWVVEHVDVISGARTLNKSDAILLNDGRASGGAGGDFGPPVSVLRAKISVEFQQAASGVCNIAPVIPEIVTLDPGFAGNLQSMLTTEVATGWSFQAGAYDHDVERGVAELGDLGTSYYVQVRDDNDWGEALRNRDFEARLTGSFIEHKVDVRQLNMSFDYRRDITEELEVIMPTGMNGARTAGVETVIEVSLKDISNAFSYQTYMPRHYREGEMVLFNGQAYRATADHRSETINDRNPTWIRYDAVTGPGQTISLTKQERYFEKVPSDPTKFTPHSGSFFGTDVGGTVIEHLQQRLNAEGRRRLRQVRVSVRMSIDDGYDISVKDAVTLRVFSGGTVDRPTFQAITGKVVSVEKHWPHKAAPYAEVAIGVSVGATAGASVSEQYADGYADGYAETPNWTVKVGGGAGIDIARLEDPRYSVIQVRTGNGVREQLAAAASLAAAGGDVRRCTLDRPTWATLRMRPIEPPAASTRRYAVEMPFTAIAGRGF